MPWYQRRWPVVAAKRNPWLRLFLKERKSVRGETVAQELYRKNVDPVFIDIDEQFVIS